MRTVLKSMLFNLRSLFIPTYLKGKTMGKSTGDGTRPTADGTVDNIVAGSAFNPNGNDSPRHANVCPIKNPMPKALRKTIPRLSG